MNFATVIAVFKAVKTLLPLVVEFVGDIEKLFPASGQGVAKCEAVRQMLQNAYSQEQGLEATFDQTWPSLKPFIDLAAAALKLNKPA